MIGRVCGVLADKRPPHLLVDVRGIGYEIEAPMSTFYVLPAVGEEVTLYTHLVVREDSHALFGFARESERRLFRALLRVNGVGARLALSILSGVSADDFVRCIQEHDTGALTRLPGVGRKTAERLIVEMKDRLGEWAGAPGAGGLPRGGGGSGWGGGERAVRPRVQAAGGRTDGARDRYWAARRSSAARCRPWRRERTGDSIIERGSCAGRGGQPELTAS